jgi:GAF domain-containing protein
MIRLAGEILALFNRKSGWDELISEVVLRVKGSLELEAVGLRLNREDDYPYFVSRGFSDDFVDRENHLCVRDPQGRILRDADGNPTLECMCGNVIRGRTNPDLPFFTPFGSFWTNSTSELLASTSEQDRQSRTRNRCNGEGYESVALIPIRASSVTHGLLQLNDRRKGRFTRSRIEFLEGLGASIGLLFSLMRQEEELEQRKADITRLVGVRTLELAKAAEILTEEIRSRKVAETVPSPPIERLQALLDELKVLKGILPICSMCHKIRSEDGYWSDLESFIQARSGAEFSHGLCPSCYDAAVRKLKRAGTR